MAHYQQLKFIELVEKFFSLSEISDVHVLEIGSYDVNGSIRKFFPQRNYIGVDLTEGPGVDMVADGHELTFDDSAFDVTISCEVFEHNPFWKETFENMYRMTKPGGFVVFTCASTGRIEHGTKRTSPKSSPGSQSIEWDYYENLSIKDVRPVIDENSFDFSSLLYNKFSKDLYYVGIKGTDKDRKFVGREAEFSKFTTQAFTHDPTLPEYTRGMLRKFIDAIHNFPVYLACKLLSDRGFQNFQINYYKLTIGFVRYIKKLFKYE